MSADIEAGVAACLEASGRSGVKLENVVRVFGGSSREMWAADAQWATGTGSAEEHPVIIRIDQGATVLETDLGTEYAVLKALDNIAGVPSPEPLVLDAEGVFIGRPFFVMAKDEGQASELVFYAPEFAENQATIGREMMRVLGRCAAIEPAEFALDGTLELPSIEDAGVQELERWATKLDDFGLRANPITRAAVRWLRRQPPRTKRLSLVHGDYRVGNFLFGPDRLISVLDWELAHFGDPLEDLAWALAKNWRSRYSPDGVAGLSVQDAISEWESTSGVEVDPEALRWWNVFTQVKAMAALLTGTHSYSVGTVDTLYFGTMSARAVDTYELWMTENMEGALR